MATYISLINFTDQGIRGFKETTERAKAAGQLASRLGGELTDIYWTVGPYDIVTVCAFPDDESATAYMLQLSSLGNIRTTTLRAFGAEQMAQIIAKVS